MLHHADVGGDVAEFRELCRRSEGLGHTQCRHHLLEADVRLRLKARQFYIDDGAFAHPLEPLPRVALQRLCHIVHGLALLGQKDGHAVGVVAVGEAQGLAVVRFRVAELMLLMHHRHFLLLLVAFERLVLRVALVELLRPGTLEVDGVQQIAHRFGVELVLAHHLLNHLLRVVAAPLVDDVECLAVGKVACLGLRVVVGLGLVHKRFLQFVALVHVDGVGYHHLREFVEGGSLGEHLAAESVDAVGPCVAEAQHLVDFLLRLTGGAVVQHTQSVGDADGREDNTLWTFGAVAGKGIDGFARPCETEQIECKLVVAVYQLLFGTREGDSPQLVVVTGERIVGVSNLITCTPCHGHHCGDGCHKKTLFHNCMQN